MKLLPKYIAALAAICAGIGLVLLADADDAPGLGLIGFAIILFTIWSCVRSALRQREQQ